MSLIEAVADQPIAVEGAEFARLSRSLFGNIEQRFVSDLEYGRLESTMAGASRINRVATSPLRVWIEKVAPRSYDPDFIKLLFQVSGETHFRQAGRTAHLTPGTWVLFDPIRPYDLLNATMIEQVVVQLPRTTFPRPMLSLFDRPHLFPADEVGLARIVQSLLETSIAELGALEPSELVRVGEIVGQLAVAALAGRRQLCDDNAPLYLLRERVKSHIEANLGDPALDIETLARQMGCSRRYIHRAFEDDETTVERFLWDRRLERSKSRLIAPEFASTSISEVAFVSGFNSSAHFSRAFRARFGCTPRQYRASAGHPG